MLTSLYNKEPFLPKEVFSTTYKRLRPVLSTRGEHISSESIFEDYDFAGNVSIYSSSVFDMDNIIAVGSYGNLKPVVINEMSSMTFADHFQGINLTKK